MSEDIRQETDELTEHWVSTIGHVPDIISSVRRMNEDYFAGYTRIRASILEERPDGLSVEARELVFIVVDVLRENLSGAKNHVRAALRAGVSRQQLADTLTMILLTCGMVTHGKIGHELWEFIEAETEK